VSGAEELKKQQRQWQLVDSALRGVWFTGVNLARQGV